MKSAATARPKPPASAKPGTRAITGGADRGASARITRATPSKWRRLRLDAIRGASISPRSAPAQKARVAGARAARPRAPRGRRPRPASAASSSVEGRAVERVAPLLAVDREGASRPLAARRRLRHAALQARARERPRPPRRLAAALAPAAGAEPGRSECALRLDLLLHLELEAGVVGLVVAGAADLEDHAGVALVGERDDRAALRGRLAHVVAARPVAGLAADAGERRVLRGRAVLGEAARAAEAGRVAAQAPASRRPWPRLQRREGARRGRATAQRRVLARVAALAGLRADVGGARRQQRLAALARARSRRRRFSSRGSAASAAFAACEIFGRKLRVVEAERVLRVVAAEAGALVVAVPPAGPARGAGRRGRGRSRSRRPRAPRAGFARS